MQMQTCFNDTMESQLKAKPYLCLSSEIAKLREIENLSAHSMEAGQLSNNPWMALTSNSTLTADAVSSSRYRITIAY